MPTNKRLKRARKAIALLQHTLLTRDSCLCQMHTKTASLQKRLISQNQKLEETSKKYSNLMQMYKSLQSTTKKLQTSINQILKARQADDLLKKQSDFSTKNLISKNNDKVNEMIKQYHERQDKMLKEIQLKQANLEKEVQSLKKITQESSSNKKIIEPVKVQPKPQKKTMPANYNDCPHLLKEGTCRNCLLDFS